MSGMQQLWAWLLGGGLIVALIALVLLNPLAALRLVKSLGALLLEKARALVDWARDPKRDWWRIGCAVGAAACFYLAVQLQLTETRATQAEAKVVLVQQQSIAAVQAEKDRGVERVAGVQAQCAADKANANAAASLRYAELERANRALERRLGIALSALNAQHDKEKEDAKRTADAVRTGVLDGSIRLRDEWQDQAGANGEAGGSAVPDAAGGAAQQDDAAELRATGAGALVGIADACDADIRYYQSVIRLDRQAQGAGAEGR